MAWLGCGRQRWLNLANPGFCAVKGKARVLKLKFLLRTKPHTMDPLIEIEKLARNLGLPAFQPSVFPHPGVSEMRIGEEDCTLIKGDNLVALQMLVASHRDQLDFCYIDPPYNTGSKFAYHDRRFSNSLGIWGKHEEWMEFMLPRLVLLKRLLKDSGLVAVSIDDYEYSQLKVLLDHVFGSDNHIGTVIVHRSKNGKGSKAHIAVSHEYVVLYGKTKAAHLLGLPEQDIASYDKIDEHGRYKIDGLFRKKGEASRRTDRPNMYFPLYYDQNGRVFTENGSGDLREAFPIDSKGIERRWLWGRDKVEGESWRLFASAKGTIYVKNYLTEEKRIKIRSIWDSPRYLTERATKEITEIYGEKVFDTPKPLALIEDLIKCCTRPDALVIDFFAGSGTTAEAAHNVNQEDQGTRKVLLVEQDAQIPAEHIATSRGFKFVADITEYRLQQLAARTKFTYKVRSV